MTETIKLTTDQIKLMSLFQNVTGATARDCIEDEKLDRVIFIVNQGKMGLAIGKGGTTNKRLDGSMQAIVVVDAKKKGIVVGREGRNAEKARLLAKRYFQISSVLIQSPEKIME